MSVWTREIGKVAYPGDAESATHEPGSGRLGAHAQVAITHSSIPAMFGCWKYSAMEHRATFGRIGLGSQSSYSSPIHLERGGKCRGEVRKHRPRRDQSHPDRSPMAMFRSSILELFEQGAQLGHRRCLPEDCA